MDFNVTIEVPEKPRIHRTIGMFHSRQMIDIIDIWNDRNVAYSMDYLILGLRHKFPERVIRDAVNEGFLFIGQIEIDTETGDLTTYLIMSKEADELWGRIRGNNLENENVKGRDEKGIEEDKRVEIDDE